jgi:hypothetical protein
MAHLAGTSITIMSLLERFDPIRDIQVLCPMNRGSLASAN